MTASDAPPTPATSEDTILGGRLRLRQPLRGHRAGSDAVLLAAAVAEAAHVADLGAGIGTVGLAIALRLPSAGVTAYEIDPALAELARVNAAANGLAARVAVRCRDVADAGRGEDAAAAGAFDHVVMNPPFHPSRGQVSPDAATDRARRGAAGLLELWVRAATRLLEPHGMITLIHRPDAIGEILEALEGRFGALALRAVHASEAQPAVRLIVQGRRGSRAVPVLLPPLVLGSDQGRMAPEAEAIHRDLAVLDMRAGGSALQRQRAPDGRPPQGSPDGGAQ